MLRKVLFTWSLVSLSFGVASITASEFIPHDALIEGIVANADNCVAGYQDEKIYLNAESIIPTAEGVFLNLNGQDHVALPYLYSDQDGCYIAASAKHLIERICPGCDMPYIFRCQTLGCKYNPNTPKDKK